MRGRVASPGVDRSSHAGLSRLRIEGFLKESSACEKSVLGVILTYILEVRFDGAIWNRMLELTSMHDARLRILGRNW